jgi:hypothetical protein
VCMLHSIILPWSVAKKGNYGHNIQDFLSYKMLITQISNVGKCKQVTKQLFICWNIKLA